MPDLAAAAADNGPFAGGEGGHGVAVVWGTACVDPGDDAVGVVYGCECTLCCLSDAQFDGAVYFSVEALADASIEIGEGFHPELKLDHQVGDADLMVKGAAETAGSVQVPHDPSGRRS